MLQYYQNQLYSLLGVASTTTLYTPTQVNAAINEARNQVAMRSQCVRCLTPVSGPISSVQLVTGGSGYLSTPTVTITGPDFPSGFLPNAQGLQATATCSISGGSVTSITLLSGGAGYFAPGVTLTGGSAAVSATATAIINNVTATVQGQEQYPFSYFLNAIQLNTAYSGINNVVAVKSISYVWGTFRYCRIETSFSKYQALVRTWSQAYQDIPSFASQYGQGVNGTFFMYPVANAAYQFEADCFCLPVPLIDDNTFEAIPQPWVDCVQYYAANKLLLGAGRYDDAMRMSNDDPRSPGLFQQQMVIARKSSEQSTTSNWYGRPV
jgi:hypothetical protein